MSTLTQRAHGEPERQGDPTKALQRHIKAMEAQFQLAMPRGVEASQLVRDAITALRTTPGLAECDAQSVLGGLMTCSQLGLRVGVLGQAWLLPFWDSKSRSKKAQLIVGYQGLTALAYRSDQIASISARVVRANDPVFEVRFGTEDELIHRPQLSGSRGDAIAYYAVCHLKEGRALFDVMSREDMEAHRDRYATAKRKDGTVVGPWRDNFEEMALKTMIRRLAKWMPKSTELNTALMADEGVRVDLTPTSSVEHVTHHYDIEGEVVEEAASSPEPEDPGQQSADPSDPDDPWTQP